MAIFGMCPKLTGIRWNVSTKLILGRMVKLQEELLDVTHWVSVHDGAFVHSTVVGTWSDLTDHENDIKCRRPVAGAKLYDALELELGRGLFKMLWC